MTEPLFYLNTLPETGAVLTLTGDEARHAAGARRLAVGDMLWLFDGRGTMARARMQTIGQRGHTLEAVLEERHVEPPPAPAIHLACAIPKGDRMTVLLDMATQLGMTRFTPLLCTRSVVKPGAGSADRWRRICLEACKQSRRPYLPEIREPATLARIVADSGSLWLAHPSGENAAQALPRHTASLKSMTVLIGPEGGFTEEEVAQATAQGAKLVALGPGILRIETAAVALLAMLRLYAGTPNRALPR